MERMTQGSRCARPNRSYRQCDRTRPPVWYIRLEDEGHGSWNWDHDAYVKYAQILFLNRYLVGGADKDLVTRLP